jgi:hypothetical protein
VIESSSASGEEGEKNKKGLIENSWVGKRITIGEDNIVPKVTSPCTRCVMISLPQGDFLMIWASCALSKYTTK